MDFFNIYPASGRIVGPAGYGGGGGGFGGHDFSSQCRVMPNTILAENDPVNNRKTVKVNSYGSSPRRLWASPRQRLPLTPKPLKIEEKEHRNGNKAANPRSPGYMYLPYLAEELGAIDQQADRLLTEYVSEVQNRISDALPVHRLPG